MIRGVGLAVLAVLLAGGAWWWSHGAPPATLWQGYAEADFVKIGPTQAGLLTKVAVQRGDAIPVGAALFTQDETADRAGRDQAAQLLAQADALLANLEDAGKPTEIAKAAAAEADARALMARTSADLARGEALLPTGTASRQTVDTLRADASSALAKLEAATAELARVRAPLGRTAELAGARAGVAAAKAGLAVAEWRLGQRQMLAPVAGVIADVLARPGETIAAGVPVVSLLPPGNIVVRFFVPEASLATMHRGDQVGLACDHCPPDLAATIAFISQQAEYTPPLIYSEASKAKLVFMIEARPRAAQAALLNPGLPILVRPIGPP